MTTPDILDVQPRRSGALRRDLSARNLERAARHAHGATPSEIASVVYHDENGSHGNFFPASYRRICARPEWRQRLSKTYTAQSRLPRSKDRAHAELDCAASSDALLMNIFCHAPVLRSPRLLDLLSLRGAVTPEFGVRTLVPLRGGYDDRTEVDMHLGDLLVEAKLSEGDFQTGRVDLLERYEQFASIFDPDLLPRRRGGFASYQLLRGAMAMEHHSCRFALFCDSRRPDLIEDWFAVLRAMRTVDGRSRMLLVTWQEIAACVPRTLQAFLLEKYGVEPRR